MNAEVHACADVQADAYANPDAVAGVLAEKEGRKQRTKYVTNIFKLLLCRLKHVQSGTMM